MNLRVAISDVTKIGTGAWTARLTPAEVRRLGESASSIGKRSVVGVADPNFSEAIRELSIAPDETTVLNVGTTDETLIIDLGRNAAEDDVESMPALGPLEANTPMRKGDKAFLSECHRLLDSALAEMGERLLAQVRRNHPREMREGQARKWVNYPDNFLAMVIQPRDKSFAVHIKGNPDSFDAPSLDIKPDRGSYSRFKLQHHSQLADAIQVVLVSARRSTGR